MSDAAKADSKAVGTLSIRVKRAGSKEWENHGTVPVYAVPVDPEVAAELKASASREEK